MTQAQAAPPLRHPLDPEPVTCSKATAVLVLGGIAAVTGFLLGGVIPAVVALLLARSARADMIAAGGYLTGVRRLRVGERLAWIGIVLAVTAIVAGAVIGLIHAAGTPHGQHFGPGVD